ncbi:MAG: thrombospondin type 3 repeat-containing protein [Saprospiraceae bacterium]|nr:thrombospondin type 3 repeat-containing protein [Saprospiraceae bacterium]
MKTIISFSLVLFMVQVCLGQSSSNITNIDWSVDKEKKVINISYDLAKIEHYSHWDVQIQAQIDGEVIEARSMHGDIGKYIQAGKGKRIQWQVFQDVEELKGSLEFVITATNDGYASANKDSDNDGVPDRIDRCPYRPGLISKQGCAPSLPIWAGLAPVAATGATLVTSGLVKQSGAVKTFDNDFQCMVDPNCANFDPDAALGLQSELEKDWKKGRTLAIGGAVILVASGALIINRMIKKKRMRKAQQRKAGFTLAPDLQTDFKKGSLSTQMGLRLNYSF